MSETASDTWERSTVSLRRSLPYRTLRRRLGKVVRLPMPAAAWVAELLAADLDRPLLIVVAHEIEATAWLEAARLFCGTDAVYFPAPSLTPYHDAGISLGVRVQEAAAADAIVRGLRGGARGGVGGGARTVITTPRALFRRLPPATDFAPSARRIEAGTEIELGELMSHLVRWGYSRCDLVFEVGQFAVRGGVFDFFPPGPLCPPRGTERGEHRPVRLDLFGDTVESIRHFDLESQRSEDSVDAVDVVPMSLFPQGGEEARDLADLLALRAGPGASIEVAERIDQLRQAGGFDGWEHYLPYLAAKTVTLAELLCEAAGREPLVVALDSGTLLDETERHAEHLATEYHIRIVEERLALPPEDLEHPTTTVRDLIESAEVELDDLLAELPDAVDFAAWSTDLLHNRLPLFAREVEIGRERGDRVVLVVSDVHRSRFGEFLGEQGIAVGGDGVELVGGELQRGFRLPAAGLTVFGERQLLRRSPLRRQPARKKRYGPFLSSLRDLKIGDYIVHSDHGIGQFVALRSMGGGPAVPRTGTGAVPSTVARASAKVQDNEVMEIAYAGGQRLLLPLSRLDLVQKYSGIEGVAPRLDRLGGTSWTRTKTRIKKGMRDMAQDLLKLYAERELARAPEIGTDSDLIRQFDEAFEWEETPDQLDAIRAIREDLGRRRPMDRLLCGDVGFGKTEVAMRAAFTCVDAGYQVAVLAPTTILADQHYETFQRRFDGFPVTVEMISRFRTTAEVREIRGKAAQGKVDVLIGTHRLLAKEIAFPRLGLVVVDEEQRFGVAHKERLKKLRKDVHVLAMSATPVPRTLQLSLAGVRDLSLIETPPRDRMAVETAILPYDAQLIREAVEFEMERGGQIYYVFNRVESIDRHAAYLREIVPGLKLTVGHGQMDEHELSRRMHAFVAGEYHLLLATTIIENGIDIPNVNTMIVHRADRFGLSQLYQLRGRVGRSDQLAYCYLLVSSDRVLTQEARKRLDAIREFTELGAGFRVAGRDLEIRGAGNLLGAEQSGHISAVGIETYLKLLEESVAEMRGEAPEEAPSVALDLPVSMSIPEDYIGDPNLRMEIYRRLATSDEPREELLGELRDRFGKPPAGVLELIEAAVVKRLAESLRLQSISARGGKLVLHLRQDARVDPDRIIQLVNDRPGTRFSPSGALTFDGVPVAEVLRSCRTTLEYLGADA